MLYISTLEHGDITSDHAPALKQLLITHADTFAESSIDLGFSSVLQHDIDTGTAQPIRQQPRRPPLAIRDAEDEILTDMLNSRC